MGQLTIQNDPQKLSKAPLTNNSTQTITRNQNVALKVYDAFRAIYRARFPTLHFFLFLSCKRKNKHFSFTITN